MSLNNSKKSGFTLIELLMVISIIGLLSSIILASLGSARKKAQIVAVAQELHQLQNAMELYRIDRGSVINELKWDNSFNILSGDTNFHEDAGGDTDFYTTLGSLTPNYIKNITKGPQWPNNGSHGMVLGYASYPAVFSKGAFQSYFTCGDKPWGAYTFYVYDVNYYSNSGSTIDYDLNGSLQKLKSYIYSGGNYVLDTSFTPDGIWCITE